MNSFAILAAAAAFGAVQAPIDIDAPPSAVVQLGDLDLGSAHGKSVLKHRIASAIEEVCGSYANVTESSELDRIGMCRVAARQSADDQLAARPSTLRLASNISR